MKVRVSIINYSNTIPFQYGLLQNKALQKQSEFLYHYPSQGLDLLLHNKVDICIVPIAAIPHIPHSHIISNYCIGASNKVNSVCLFSNKPILDVTKITLDYQSKTSNLLTKILVHEVWNIQPTFEQGYHGYETANDGSAKVIIGDRALEMHGKFNYVYDLSEEWHKAFGLPFVFACWVANKPISPDYCKLFEESLQFGIEHIDEAIQWANKPVLFDMKSYLKNNIDFNLTNEKRKSMELFYEKAKLVL